MKKSDVLQLAIIIVGIMIGYEAINYLMSALTNGIYLLTQGEFVAGSFSPLLILLLVALVTGTVGWTLMSKSRQLADFIYEKSGLGQSFQIAGKPEDLLWILLVASGFYFLIEGLPPLLKAVINGFRSGGRSRFDSGQEQPPTDWLIVFIKLLLPLVLLMAARPIAQYFGKQVSDEPILISDNAGDIDYPDDKTV